MKINSERIKGFLQRGVAKIIKKDSLEEKLKSGRKLRIKHGVDPTTSDLHIGHSVVYLKMKELQEMGHQIVFLVGDFTGRFGDPSEKLVARKLRPQKEVRALAKNYLEQVGKIIDLKKTEVRYNSEWYDKMSAEGLLKLMSSFTVQRMLERDMFQKRIEQNKEIRLQEPVYPALQGYDSVVLKADIAICGNDQLFNEIKGRELQSEFSQPPQDVVATKLLVGLDGREKMSQSLGNDIKIKDSPQEQYGKIMSVPDSLIQDYFELATRVPLEEIKRGNPRDLKAKLARAIVEIYHSKKKADKAEQEFNKVFKNKGIPDNMPEIKISEKKLPILDLLTKTGLVSSKSEAKRLVLQKGVRINREVQESWDKEVDVEKGMIIQIGKRRFAKIV
jgi:tyrosyl-tRNA synthetase